MIYGIIHMSTNTFYRIDQESQKEELEDVHYEKII
jgi:hypothetical protein